jgi:hypothetical protein
MTNRIVPWLKYIILGLAVLLAILVFFFVRNYFELRRSQIITGREFWTSAFIKSHGPLSAADVGLISPWMTFDYINKTFLLPASYLQTSLSISDPHYPQVSLGGYAKSHHLDAATLTAQAQSAVRNYLSMPQGTSTSAQ